MQSAGILWLPGLSGTDSGYFKNSTFQAAHSRLEDRHSLITSHIGLGYNKSELFVTVSFYLIVLLTNRQPGGGWNCHEAMRVQSTAIRCLSMQNRYDTLKHVYVRNVDLK